MLARLRGASTFAPESYTNASGAVRKAGGDNVNVTVRWHGNAQARGTRARLALANEEGAKGVLLLVCNAKSLCVACLRVWLVLAVRVLLGC